MRTDCLADLAHVSTRDDIYKDYYIPKGSLVMANIWYTHYTNLETPLLNEAP